MRPYLALIYDSFREAFVSRTMWLLVGPVTLLLAAVAPLQITGRIRTTFHWRDITRPESLAETLLQTEETSESAGGESESKTKDAELKEDDKPKKDETPREGTAAPRGDRGNTTARTPAAHVWQLIPEGYRSILRDELQEDNRAGRNTFSLASTLAGAFNAVLRRRDLYDPELWKEIEKNDELDALLEQPQADLTDAMIARRNRLLIESAFPRSLRGQDRGEVVLSYFGLQLFWPLPFEQKWVTKAIEEWIVPTIVGFFIGIVGVLIAVLVTAPIIPRLFDEGALHLLLSKPIFRSGAFLAKFFGGCAFILLGATYFVVGLWLILGWRFGIWNHGLLTSIPVFLFIFSVYYSISALAGAIWRNAIVAVAMTAGFWVLGFAVSLAYGLYHQTAIVPQQSSDVLGTNDELVRTTRSGGIERWSADRADWEPIVKSSFAMGYDIRSILFMDVEKTERHEGGLHLFAILPTGRMQLIDQPRLLVATAENDWQGLSGPKLPRGAFRLLKDPRGRLLVAARDNLYEITDWKARAGEEGSVFGGAIDLRRFLGNSSVKAIGPSSDWALQGPSAAEIDPVDGTIAVYDAGNVMLFQPTKRNRYRLAKREKIVDDDELGADVAIGKDTIVVITADGRLLEVDRATLQPRNESVPEPSSQPRQVFADPSRTTFAIQYHNGTVHLLRRNGGQTVLERPRWLPQKRISAARFRSDGKLLVARNHREVRLFDVSTGTSQQQWRPPLAMYEQIFFYGVRPLNWVVPKPGELKQTAHYFMSGKETLNVGTQSNIREFRERLNPWQPVWQSGIFLAFMLFVTCLMIERQDF